jgi:hypothetical protein
MGIYAALKVSSERRVLNATGILNAIKKISATMLAPIK